MAISTDQIDSKPKNKELYAYNPATRFRIYERNINGLIYYKFFPDVFKEKVISQLKIMGIKIPLDIVENSNGWIRVVVPEEHKNDETIKDMVSNIANEDMDDYYEKKMKLYSSKGWQVVLRNI